MDATELAHWRYRVKALTPEVTQWEEWLSQTSADALRWPDDELFTNLRDDTRATLDYLRWLLEEARYKCELGETLCHLCHVSSLA